MEDLLSFNELHQVCSQLYSSVVNIQKILVHSIATGGMHIHQCRFKSTEFHSVKHQPFSQRFIVIFVLNQLHYLCTNLFDAIRI